MIASTEPRSCTGKRAASDRPPRADGESDVHCTNRIGARVGCPLLEEKRVPIVDVYECPLMAHRAISKMSVLGKNLT